MFLVVFFFFMGYFWSLHRLGGWADARFNFVVYLSLATCRADEIVDKSERNVDRGGDG